MSALGGKADIVVLEANPFEVDPLQIEEINVLLTMVDGRVVHQVESGDDDALHPKEPHVSTEDFSLLQ